MIQSGMILEDRYEILEKIGTGGMSDVYKAKCHKLNRYVAIKFLKPEYCEDKNFVTNFLVEAQSAAALLHPNVVSVYDVNEINGIYYIVMEYVDGITLKKYISINGRLQVKEATSIAIQVVQGMEAAHNAGIVHRDIKPQNVLISREGKIKVTDFGIARTTTANTLSTDVLGSAQYISPEQARGDVVDARSDIYSFGIMFFEMLTGMLPFVGDSPVAVALKHIQERVPLVSEVIPDAPASLVKIVEKCTQKRPDRRYQKTSSLLSDLKTSLVNPNDDFVIMETEQDEGATVVISKKDAAALRSEMTSANVSAGASQRRVSQGMRTAANANANVNANRRRTMLVDDEDAYEGLVDEEEEDEEEVTASRRKFDKILTICGIAAGIIIVVVLIIVCISLFGNGGCHGCSGSEESTKATEETTADTKVQMPDVVGETLANAQKRLSVLNILYEVKTETSSTVPKDQVIKQSVEAGEEISAGSKVTLTVSAGSETVKLTDYAGMTQADAEAKLKAAGFTVNVTTKYDDDVETGKVISTNPVAGSEVAKDATIELIVSRGKEKKETTVPVLVGATEEEARALCEAAKLGMDVTYQENDAQAGKVISQSVTAGENKEEGTVISVTVGKKSEVTVSNVVGMELAAGKAALEAQGLSVNYTETVDDNNVGKIISQNPGGGNVVTKGTTITLEVGKESEKITIPDLVGKTLEEAKGAVEPDGIVVEFSYVEDDENDGKVISQSITAGTKVPAGTVISLVLGQKKAESNQN